MITERKKGRTETTGVFSDRLEDLIKASGKTLDVIAKEADIKSKASLTKYQNDEAEIGINNLVKLAKYFNVSTDYLLGLVNDPTIDKNIKSISYYTGLTEESIEFLSSNRKNEVVSLTINAMLQNVELLRLIYNYCLTGLYDDFFKSDFNCLPLRQNTLLRNEYASKILLSGIIEVLPNFKDIIKDRIESSKSLKNKLIFLLAVKNVNLKACNSEIEELKNKLEYVDWSEICVNKEAIENEYDNMKFIEFLNNLPNEELRIEEQEMEEAEMEKRIKLISDFLQKVKDFNAS